MGRTRHSSLQAKGMLPLRKDISHCIPSFPFLCRYLAHNNRQKQLFDKLPFIFVGVSCIVTLSFNSSPCHEMINEPYFSRQNARDRCTTAFPQALSVNIEKRSIKLYITFFFSFFLVFVHSSALSSPLHISYIMSSKDNVLFSDIFDIKDVDGAGKKFDKGNGQATRERNLTSFRGPTTKTSTQTKGQGQPHGRTRRRTC